MLRKFFLIIVFGISLGHAQQSIYRQTNLSVNDLLHTRLEVSFDWNTSRLNGKAWLILRPYFYPTRMCFLNARGMEIKKISCSADAGNNKREELQVTYRYENDSLKIDLGKELTSQQTYTVYVEYVAHPEELKTGGSSAIRSDKGLYFINPKGKNPYKMPQIWTQGETQSNSVWFPTIDSPHEKTTQELFITVNKKYTTLSNGILVSSKSNPDGTRTDYWKMDRPHAPYLFMMAVGEFRKITDSPWKGREISYYVEKEFEKYAKEYFKNTAEMIDFYSKRLGVEYPWPKYAQVVCRDYVSGAMENTSATLHGEAVIYCGKRELMEQNRGESVIAHELFHQWFGDLVTCESWSNLPLNESFATYGEYLWIEHKFGRNAADHHHFNSRRGYLAQNRQVPLIRFYYKNREDMFDAFSYNKGGQILHMLRKFVGDEAFFKALQTYLNQRKFRTAEIHDLRMAFEEVTGLDMNPFFNQWFLKEGHPVLEIQHEYHSDEKKIVLNITQKQDSTYPTYVMPAQVEYYIKGTRKTYTFEVSERINRIVIPSEEKPEYVAFNPEGVLLAEVKHSKNLKEWCNQYKNSEYYFARREALEVLADSLLNPEAADIFFLGLNDPFYALRNFALNHMTELKNRYPEKVKENLFKIFENDIHLPNRADALEILLKEYSDINADALCEKSLAVGSAGMVNTVLKYYSEKNPEKAYSLVQSLQNEEDSKSVILNMASIISKKADPKDIEFFRSKFVYLNEFEMVSFLAQYISYAKKLKDPEAVKKVADDLAVFMKEGGNFVRVGCASGLKSLSQQWKKTDEAIGAYIEGLMK